MIGWVSQQLTALQQQPAGAQQARPRPNRAQRPVLHVCLAAAGSGQVTTRSPLKQQPTRLPNPQPTSSPCRGWCPTTLAACLPCCAAAAGASPPPGTDAPAHPCCPPGVRQARWEGSGGVCVGTGAQAQGAIHSAAGPAANMHHDAAPLFCSRPKLSIVKSVLKLIHSTDPPSHPFARATAPALRLAPPQCSPNP